MRSFTCLLVSVSLVVFAAAHSGHGTSHVAGHGNGPVHRRQSHNPSQTLTSRDASVMGPVTNLNIVNAEIAPDGFSRGAVLAGGMFPGPLITGWKGQYFAINVVNKLTDDRMLKSTSIHWHGFYQKGRNWVDGPAFINQCPIAPGHSFLYDFPNFNQAGTFWYHSHLSTQYCDGLRGAFVVYDPLDPYLWYYDVDDASTVITLSDWYHNYAKEITFGTADSTLINGKGRYIGGPQSQLAVISVKRNVRYRMRLVSLSCDPNYTFSIDGHSMTIIEVDGISHKQNKVDQIQIFAGQRYSFILTANRPVGNYWVRAHPNMGPQGYEGGINSAILRYVGAPAQEPTTRSNGGLDPLRESELVPMFWPAAPGRPWFNGADVYINLDMAFNYETGKFTINGNSFVSPTVPVLLQIFSGAKKALDLLPLGNLIQLPANKVVQLSMPAGALAGPHPFHLHGHAFSVVRAAGSKDYNFFNPPQRDVVSIGEPGDNVTIRFATDNTGPWFLHCHIDWHLENGLAMVFAENSDRVPLTNNPSAAWKDLCPIYNALPESDH